jgi:ketosteroid isomerase-like protein
MARSTKELVEAMYEALNTGDLEVAASHVADDVIFVVPKSVPLQPEGHGIAAWRDFRRRVVATMPDLRAEVTRISGGADAVVVDGFHHTRASGPVPFRHFLGFRDGLLVEFRESLDAGHALRWWSAVREADGDRAA